MGLDLNEYVFDGLLAGASGFLLKHAPPEEILLAVRAAAAGDALVSPGPMRRLVEHFVRGRPRQSADLDRLTGREREVFVLMVRGLSNAEIARSLVIGETTAKTHVTRILTKLQLRSGATTVPRPAVITWPIRLKFARWLEAIGCWLIRRP